MIQKLIECVPNFSEGRDMQKIKEITDQIEAVEGVKLLDVDPGKATNRTVVTFVGTPEAVVEAAFQAIKKAGEVIDMKQHKGEHPRFGATDVCPFIPISGLTMEETVVYAKKLAERVGNELNIPVYLYEYAANKKERKNLATIRAGEYEGLSKKLTDPAWKPDYGPDTFNEKVAKTGVTVIGARDFLIAYNVNLNTTSTRRANAIAFDVREAGRVKREGNKMTGKILRDKNGEALRTPGTLKAVKAIGWYIDEYGICQISMNLTNINITPLHTAFEEVRKSASKRGMRVTGSELVGLVPLQSMLDAGKYFLKQQKRSLGISESEIIKIAVKSMGLDDLAPFDPQKKIIEYVMQSEDNARPLVQMSLKEFAGETASESVAPGGGSVSAYAGALGIALGTMVANLSSHKRGWDKRWAEFSLSAEKGQGYLQKLIHLVDEDTIAYNKIINAFRLPKITNEDKLIRKKAIEEATKYAIEVPLEVMETALQSMEVIEMMAKNGNPNSASDAGVGALCARTAVMGAYLNVKINVKDLEDRKYADSCLKKAKTMAREANKMEKEILKIVDKVVNG